MCRKFWRKIDFNCFYEYSSFAGASVACPAPGKIFWPRIWRGLTPAKFFDPAPGGAFAPAKLFDATSGGALAPAKFFGGLAGAYPGPRNSFHRLMIRGFLYSLDYFIACWCLIKLLAQILDYICFYISKKLHTNPFGLEGVKNLFNKTRNLRKHRAVLPPREGVAWKLYWGRHLKAGSGEFVL